MCGRLWQDKKTDFTHIDYTGEGAEGADSLRHFIDYLPVWKTVSRLF